MQIHIDQRGVHEARELDLEQNAGLVCALLEQKLVATLIALTDLALRIVDRNGLLLLLLLLKLPEIAKHPILLRLLLLLPLLFLHLLVLLNPSLLRVGVLELLRVLVLLLYDVLLSRLLQLSHPLLKPLPRLKSLAL